MIKKEIKWDTLEGVLKGSWTMLKRGVDYFNDPFHRPVLGTTGKDGSNLRMVILRHFILPNRILVCHSDARSAKVQEISNFAKVSWLFYHPKRKVQLRISGRGILHTYDQFADEQWRATKITNRYNYGTTEPPGTPIDKPSSGLSDLFLNKVPTLLESENCRENFMVIACQIKHMDWLILRTLGNRRARFDWDKNGLNAKWLIP